MAENALEVNTPVPAPANIQGASSDRLPRAGLGGGQSPTSASSAFRTILEQPGVQRILPAVVVLFSLAALSLIYAYVSAPSARPMFSGLSDADRQVAYDALKVAGSYGVYIDQNTGQLMIPEDEYFDAKLYLASQNIPRSASGSNFEELLSNESMTRSRNMEAAQLKEFDERELKETIEAIYSIKSAKVQIARPQQSVFVREREPAKASVYVEPFGGRMITQANIQAIVHLVSSSVPYLPPENVSVVNNSGMLLTGGNDKDSALSLASNQREHERGVEANYRERVDQIMSRFVGFDKVRSEVDVKMNFTEIQTTYEDFDRNNEGGLTRSEVINSDEQSTGNQESEPQAGTFVTAPEQTEQAAPNSKNLSSSTTRNYELDREIRFVKQQIGEIDRVTVSVAFDRDEFLRTNGIVGADGNTQTDISAQQLSDLEGLIKGAIGFNQDRGDTVTIVPMRFFTPEIQEPVPEKIWDVIENYVADPSLRYLLQMGIATFLVLLTLFVVVRPALRFYTSNGIGNKTESSPHSGELSPDELLRLRQGERGDLQEIKTKLMPRKSSIPEDMLDTANTYDEKIALMKMISADDPGKVANLIKRMIAA